MMNNFKKPSLYEDVEIKVSANASDDLFGEMHNKKTQSLQKENAELKEKLQYAETILNNIARENSDSKIKLGKAVNFINSFVLDKYFDLPTNLRMKGVVEGRLSKNAKTLLKELGVE